MHPGIKRAGMKPLSLSALRHAFFYFLELKLLLPLCCSLLFCPPAQLCNMRTCAMQQPGSCLKSLPTSQIRPECRSAALHSLCSCIARHISLQQLHHVSARKCSLSILTLRCGSRASEQRLLCTGCDLEQPACLQCPP